VHDRATTEPASVRFGPFEVNLRTGDVHANGAPVTLQEQPLRILIRLLEAKGEIVSRDDLRAELWPRDTFVDFEHGLNAAVKRLRHALDDAADAPRFVETIPRRGYRFIGRVETPVTAGTPAARRWRLAAAAAGALALAAQVWFLAGRTTRDTAARPIAPAAYDTLVQGLFASRRWQSGSCPEAERHLLEAIAIDPTAADAYAHLGYCYVFPDRMRRPGWETAPKARAAAERALALDPRSALAHVVAGRIKLHYDFDWKEAEREFRRAIELNPAESEAFAGYGDLLYASGRGEQALSAERHGLRLDPLNMDHQTGYGFALRNLRRFDDAADQFRRTLEDDPGWTIARFWLAYTEADRGRQDAAVADYLTFMRQVVVPGRAESVVETMRDLYARAGWQAFWQADLALADEDNATPGSVWRAPGSYYAGPFSMARRHARLGNTQAALDWLDMAFAYRHHLMVLIAREPLFDSLRSHPRFRRLRTLVGV